VPGNAIPLATVAVAAGASSVGTISNVQPYARPGLYPAYNNGNGASFTVANGSNATQALGNIIVPTACTISLFASMGAEINGTFQACGINGYVDGAACTTGGYSYFQIRPTSGDIYPVSFKGTVHVAAGSHALSLYASNGDGGASITFQSIYWEARVEGY
jgi:hypothetical protein